MQTPPTAASVLYNWTITLDLEWVAEIDGGDYECIALYAREPHGNTSSIESVGSVSVDVGSSADEEAVPTPSAMAKNSLVWIASTVVAGSVVIAMATYMLVASSHRKRSTSLSFALMDPESVPSSTTMHNTNSCTSTTPTMRQAYSRSAGLFQRFGLSRKTPLRETPSCSSGMSESRQKDEVSSRFSSTELVESEMLCTASFHQQAVCCSTGNTSTAARRNSADAALNPYECSSQPRISNDYTRLPLRSKSLHLNKELVVGSSSAYEVMQSGIQHPTASVDSDLVASQNVDNKSGVGSDTEYSCYNVISNRKRLSTQITVLPPLDKCDSQDSEETSLLLMQGNSPSLSPTISRSSILSNVSTVGSTASASSGYSGKTAVATSNVNQHIGMESGYSTWQQAQHYDIYAATGSTNASSGASTARNSTGTVGSNLANVGSSIATRDSGATRSLEASIEAYEETAGVALLAGNAVGTYSDSPYAAASPYTATYHSMCRDDIYEAMDYGCRFERASHDDDEDDSHGSAQVPAAAAARLDSVVDAVRTHSWNVLVSKSSTEILAGGGAGGKATADCDYDMYAKTNNAMSVNQEKPAPGSRDDSEVSEHALLGSGSEYSLYGMSQGNHQGNASLNPSAVRQSLAMSGSFPGDQKEAHSSPRLLDTSAANTTTSSSRGKEVRLFSMPSTILSVIRVMRQLAKPTKHEAGQKTSAKPQGKSTDAHSNSDLNKHGSATVECNTAQYDQPRSKTAVGQASTNHSTAQMRRQGAISSCGTTSDSCGPSCSERYCDVFERESGAFEVTTAPTHYNQIYQAQPRSSVSMQDTMPQFQAPGELPTDLKTSGKSSSEVNNQHLAANKQYSHLDAAGRCEEAKGDYNKSSNVKTSSSLHNTKLSDLIFEQDEHEKLGITPSRDVEQDSMAVNLLYQQQGLGSDKGKLPPYVRSSGESSSEVSNQHRAANQQYSHLDVAGSFEQANGGYNKLSKVTTSSTNFSDSVYEQDEYSKLGSSPTSGKSHSTADDIDVENACRRRTTSSRRGASQSSSLQQQACMKRMSLDGFDLVMGRGLQLN
ncbi:uncharacterized protein LOC135827150 [Sycon ciliatum]|uniref:uncharacterized protein LOC135827150 n=1 Tax=Sycon ciliatum TaxID=27933 RepID=UPI0031F6D58A